MGIKHLWTLLAPFYERKPLYELQGKTVAIDLSCWICEAQNIAEYQVQPRMYLRNLYFRTCYLLLMDVQPVFVLEGKAPEMKYDTIAARNALQFKGSKPRVEGGKPTGKDRSRFHFTLNQCKEMLSYMGLACVKGKGEAEALCAYLNHDGLVDGCISQDSDCFAYGAKVVYRNFSISQQGSYAASGGAVDVYNLEETSEKRNFGRNKIIALALLCGSDYGEGVRGVGKETVVKWFETVDEEAVLERLRGWRGDEGLFRKYERILADKNSCSCCGHLGRLQQHNKNGCSVCGTTTSCVAGRFKEERINMKNELSMRNKAIQDPNFPDENLIQEFTIRKDKVSSLDLKWRQPDLVKFVKFTVKYLGWEEVYAFEKMLPILTRWQITNPQVALSVVPERIKKVRNPKGVASYEVIWLWQDSLTTFEDLIPANQLQDVDVTKLMSTIEPLKLVEAAYPQLVEEFRQSKVKPAKRNRKKLEDMLMNLSISEPVAKKKAQKPRKESKQETLDGFVGKTQTTGDVSFDLEASCFGDEDDLGNISEIIEGIVGKDVEEDSFFICNTAEQEEEDLFEKSMKWDEDSTSDDDSFVGAYVPLIERLRNKVPQKTPSKGEMALKPNWDECNF